MAEKLHNQIKADDSDLTILKGIKDQGVDEDVLYDLQMKHLRAWMYKTDSGGKSINLFTPAEAKVWEQISAAMEKQTDSKGGYTVPARLSREIEEELSAYGGLYSLARKITTATGETINWLKVDGTNIASKAKGELVKADDATGEPMTFSQVQFNAYRQVTDIYPISKVLLRDTQVDISGLLRKFIAEGMMRTISNKLLYGDGNNNLKGLVAELSNTPKKIQVGTNNQISYEEVVDWMYKLPAAYRPGAQMLISDEVEQILTKLKDGDGRPLWLPNMVQGIPATILGRRYTVDHSMVAWANNKKVGIYGLFDKFMIRQVGGINIMTNDQDKDYWSTDSVAVMGRMELDSHSINNNAFSVLIGKA